MLPIDYQADHNLCTDSNDCPHPYMYMWDGEHIRRTAGITWMWSHLMEMDRLCQMVLPKNRYFEMLRESRLKKSLSKSFPVVFTLFLLSNWYPGPPHRFQEWARLLDQLLVLLARWCTSMHVICAISCLHWVLDSTHRVLFFSWRKRGYVGQANNSLSYAQAGKWGDSIAAIADGGASRSCYTWIDVFDVRQWTCAIPEMDFGSTISNCTSFYHRSILHRLCV